MADEVHGPDQVLGIAPPSGPGGPKAMDSSNESVSGAAPRAADDASAEVKRLELEKLNLEISELRGWWKRPNAIGAGATAIVALLGFLSAVYVGYFDKARLEFERSRLQVQISDLEAARTQLEAEIARRLREPSPAESALRLRTEENSVLRAENERLERLLGEYHSANEGLARQNKEFEEAAMSSNAVAQQTSQELRAVSEQKEAAEKKLKASNEELSLLPVQLTDAGLSYSESSTEARGLLQGANLGDGPGKVWLRAGKAKRTLAGRTLMDEKEGIFLELEVVPESIARWTTREIRFSLGPLERNRILQARRDLLGKKADIKPDDLTFGPEIGIQFRVETNLGARSDWVLAQLSYTLRSVP